MLFGVSAYGRDSGTYTIKAVILDKTGEPLSGATMQLVQSGLWGISGKDGEVEIRNVPRLPVAYKVSMLGYKDVEGEICLDGKDNVRILMEEESLSMREVVVVAQAGQGGESTTSIIGRQALDHLQATSLKDILQLLPGGVSMKNPSLTSPGQFKVRTLASDDNATFGAAIIINGMPVSTNANMNTGLGLSSISSGNSGADLRSIATDDIESVEIIRGVASAEYGDVSSGVMIVNKRIGVSDLNMKARIMPGIMQLHAGKGFDIKSAGSLNISADYARGTSDPRFLTDKYNRGILSLAHRKTLLDKTWTLTTNIDLSYTGEWKGADPDEPEAMKKFFSSRDAFSLRLSHNGMLKLDKALARTLKYDVALSLSSDHIFNDRLVSVGSGAILDATKDGMYEGTPYPSSYETLSGTKSNPVMYWAKFSDLFYLNVGNMSNRFNVGTEWKIEGNRGIGQYDKTLKFKAFAQDRIRRFCDIPYMNQISAYVEDNVVLTFSERRYPNITGQAGVRWTVVQPWRNERMMALSPRLNIAVNPVRYLSLRLGYGISEKVPSLQDLYPSPDYYDFYNMSVSDGQKSYYLYSTRVFDNKPVSIKTMRGTKYELGFDVRLDNGMSFSVVGYHEKVSRCFGPDNSEWKTLVFDVWNAADVTFTGQKPIYDQQNPSRRDTVLYNLIRPGNPKSRRNRGIEFDFNFGKINATNTSFYLSGAWSETRSSSSNLGYKLPVGEARNYGPVYVVYPESSYSFSENRRFSATLRVVQHIPVIRFIVSASAQCILYEYDHEVSSGTRPLGYIYGSEYIKFTEDQLDDVEFNFHGYMLKDQIFDTRISNVPVTWPAIWCLDMRVTKEIGDKAGFSFYANNVLFSQPWQSNSVSVSKVERNGGLFSYGLEIFLNF
jgi:outer membrane receptor protein involved in Fe transport